MNALQHRQESRSVTERVQHERETLIGAVPIPEQLVFHPSGGYMRTTAIATGFVAPLGLVSWRAGVPWGVVVFGFVTAVGVASLLFNRWAWVGLDAHAVEGLGWPRAHSDHAAVIAVVEASLDALPARCRSLRTRILAPESG